MIIKMNKNKSTVQKNKLRRAKSNNNTFMP